MSRNISKMNFPAASSGVLTPTSLCSVKLGPHQTVGNAPVEDSTTKIHSRTFFKTGSITKYPLF